MKCGSARTICLSCMSRQGHFGVGLTSFSIVGELRTLHVGCG